MTKVDIVIGTLANSTREDLLLRAIDSILYQKEVSCRPIVVVNGDEFSHDLLNRLGHNPHLRLEKIPDKSLPAAIYHGRKVVTSSMFGYLDDDDELFPDSVSRRLALLESKPRLSLVVGNGYVYGNTDSNLVLPQDHDALAKIAGDPLMALFKRNWLPSCAGLFRGSVFHPEFFSNLQPRFEWTDIAFRAALLAPLGFISEPTYRVHDSDVSLSKIADQLSVDAYYSLIQRLRSLPGVPEHVQYCLAKKSSEAAHNYASYWRSQGEIYKAVCMHFESLFGPGGWRYLPASRHYFFDVIQRIWG